MLSVSSQHQFGGGHVNKTFNSYKYLEADHICGAAHRKVDEITPIDLTYGDQLIIDTGVFDGWENPFSSNPFGGLFGSLDGIMERIRQQIASILNRLPIGKASNDTEVLSFPGGFEQPAFPSISGIDLSKGNTTSITKVIDGHKVVINETEYKNEDDFGGTFFKVRIIDVKSDSSEVTTEKEAEALPENTTQKDREEIANSMENEIFKSREAEVAGNEDELAKNTLEDNVDEFNMEKYKNLETFDEELLFENEDEDIQSNTKPNPKYPSNSNTEWNKNNITLEASVPSNVIFDDENTITSDGHDAVDAAVNPISLSSDTYVNEILAKNQGRLNPDAEQIFDNWVVPR
ncbi:hypothetical protein YQE_04436, partial [Dendroctonus ponderosae]